HVRVVGPHLTDQRAVGVEDRLGGQRAPDVVGAEVHEHDVGVGGGQPGGQLSAASQVGDQHAPVAFVFVVVGEAAAVAGAGADEVDVGVSGVGQVTPQEGPPAAGGAGDRVAQRHDPHRFARGSRTAGLIGATGLVRAARGAAARGVEEARDVG